MKLLRSKKGNDAVSLSMEVLKSLVIIIFFVFLPTTAFISAITDSQTYEKIYLAADLSLISDSVIASPNDLIYNYGKDTKNLAFNFIEDNVAVTSGREGLFDRRLARSYFISDPNKEIQNYQVSPIYDVVSRNDEDFIPVKILVIKQNKDISFLNSKTILLGSGSVRVANE